MTAENPRRTLRVVGDAEIRTWGTACCGEGAETVLLTPGGVDNIPSCDFLELGYRRSRCRLFDSELYVKHFDDGDGSDVRPVQCDACKTAETVTTTVTATAPRAADGAPTYTKVTTFHGRASGDCECFCFDTRTVAGQQLDEEMPHEMRWEQQARARLYPDALLPREHYPNPDEPFGDGRMGTWTITATFVPDDPTDTEKESTR